MNVRTSTPVGALGSHEIGRHKYSIIIIIIIIIIITCHEAHDHAHPPDQDHAKSCVPHVRHPVQRLQRPAKPQTSFHPNNQSYNLPTGLQLVATERPAKPQTSFHPNNQINSLPTVLQRVAIVRHAKQQTSFHRNSQINSLPTVLKRVAATW